MQSMNWFQHDNTTLNKNTTRYTTTKANPMMELNNCFDVLLEKTSNIEEEAHKQKVRKYISNCLKNLAKSERVLRESTIMLKHGDELSAKEIPEMVEKDWSLALNKPTVTSWQDKTYVYLQFANWETKNIFLDFAAMNMSPKFIAAIEKPASIREHMQRKPVRVLICNVRAVYKTENIHKGLIRSLPEKGIIEFKEHKPNVITKARNIELTINEEAFKFLFGTLDGVIPYFGLTLNQKLRLSLKIFCKPWSCRQCFSFGYHQCEGKICGNCSKPQHSSRDCTQKTKYCKNCKKRGHRPKDTHCETYLFEVAKELRKYAIPMEFLENKEMRYNLTKHLLFA